MVVVYIGIGSNVEAEKNILDAIKALQALFGVIQLSPIYQSSAVGFTGNDFLNLVVAASCDFGIADLKARLRVIENNQGRDRSQLSFSDRPIDLDLLLYGDITDQCYQLPHPDMLRYAFVLKPLSDMAGKMLHPVAGLTMQALWTAFVEQHPDATRLQRVSFEHPPR